MRYIFIFLLLAITFTVTAKEVHTEDSMLQALTKVKQPSIRCYRNLADFCYATPKEKVYLKKMYSEAKKINDKASMIEALNDIALSELKAYRQDSVQHYLQLIKRIATGEKLNSILAFYRMRLFDNLCSLGKKDEAIEKELSSLEVNANSLYGEMVSAYITGSALYANNQFEESIPYLETASQMTQNLPNEIMNKFQQFILRNLGYAYCLIGQNKKGIEIIDKVIKDMELEYQTRYEKQRPFFPINTLRLQFYSFMIMNVSYMDLEQEQYYWKRVQEIGKSVSNPQDIYNYHLCTNNYYMNNNTKRDYSKALSANDTLIKYATTLAPDNVPYLYDINSQICEVLKDYQNALKYLKISHQLTDSLASNKMRQQLNELQVQYDLNKVNNEKTQLEMKNKQYILLFLSVILAIVFIICTYLYHSLKREKRMKTELKVLNQKAQESDKMKQAFINSVCHEIRTPLNAIVGFSDLLMDTSIEEDVRQEFPTLIHKNTNILTSLIDSMLEVANLDVSEEELLREPVDIRQICEQQMEQLKDTSKVGIQYLLDIPKVPIIINTHNKYLPLVIENLLSNANKFTETGQIILGCKMDNQQKLLFITVTDTGCGIPKDKYEEVFERFSKLDSFTQGNGLGLYLCRLIIKRLSGNIEIDPEYSQGTRIIVSLPM